MKLAVGNCYATTPTVSWCVVAVTTTPPRYQLWRSTATGNICTAGDWTRVRVADYLTSSNVFTTATIPYQGLETVGIDFPVSVSPTPAQERLRAEGLDRRGQLDAVCDEQRLQRPSSVP